MQNRGLKQHLSQFGRYHQKSFVHTRVPGQKVYFTPDEFAASQFSETLEVPLRHSLFRYSAILQPTVAEFQGTYRTCNACMYSRFCDGRRGFNVFACSRGSGFVSLLGWVVAVRCRGDGVAVDRVVPLQKIGQIVIKFQFFNYRWFEESAGIY